MCPNPVLFRLPAPTEEEHKENSPSVSLNQPPSTSNAPTLPYRSIFAVLTLDSILIYDTFHTKPLSISRGYHCSGLTDCSWSVDGHTLVVSSNDGYISIVRFAKGELGEVYHVPTMSIAQDTTTHSLQAQIQDSHISGTYPTVMTTMTRSSPTVQASLPPCEPGSSSAIVGPPCKKSRSCSTDSMTQGMKTPLVTVHEPKDTHQDTIRMSFLKDPPTVTHQSVPILVPTTTDVQKELMSKDASHKEQENTQRIVAGPLATAVICENKENEDVVGAVTKLSLDYSGGDGVSRKHPLQSPMDDEMLEEAVPACKKPKKRIQPEWVSN